MTNARTDTEWHEHLEAKLDELLKLVREIHFEATKRPMNIPPGRLKK